MASMKETEMIPDEVSFENRISYIHEALRQCGAMETPRRRSDTDIAVPSEKKLFLENVLRRHCEAEITKLQVYLKEINTALEQSTYCNTDLTQRNYQLASALAANDKALALYRGDKTDGEPPTSKKCSKLKKEYYRREAALVSDLKHQMDTVQNLRKLNIRLLHEIAYLRQSMKLLEQNEDNDLKEEAPTEDLETTEKLHTDESD